MKLAINSMLPPISARENQLAQLKAFLDESKRALMLIIGPCGIGKNNLTTQLTQRLTDFCVVIRASAHHAVQADDLANWLAQQLALTLTKNYTSKQNLLDEVVAQLKERQQKYLLVIENAHELSFSSLAALSHLAITQEKSQIILAIFLLGDESLVRKAQLLQNTLITKIVLNPLSKLEAFQYLHYCLQLHQPNFSGTPTETEFDTIYLESGGLPLLIYQHSKTWLKQQTARAQINTRASNDFKIETPLKSEILSTTEIQPQEPEILPATKEIIPVKWQRHAVKSVSLFGLALLSVGMHYFYHRSMLPQQPILSENVAPQPEMPKTMAVAPNIMVSETPTALPAAVTAPHFTVQLAAMDNYATAAKFVQQYKLNTNQIAVKKQQGKIWFTVDSGDFATPQAALAAQHQLPKNLQALHPWVHVVG